jgi:hypothetical protein
MNLAFNLTKDNEITNDIIGTVKSLIDTADEVNYYGSYKGLFIIKIIKNCLEFRSNIYELKEEDKKKIFKFIENEKIDSYSNGFFRIDLDDYILLFKVYHYNYEMYFIGHMVENSCYSKWELASTRSKIELQQIKSKFSIANI